MKKMLQLLRPVALAPSSFLTKTTLIFGGVMLFFMFPILAADQTIPKSFMVEPQQTVEHQVTIPAPETGKILVLKFQARLCSQAAYAGHTTTLKIKFNGQELTGSDLLDRPLFSTTQSGYKVCFWTQDEGFRIPYADNFLRGNQLKHLTPAVKMHDFMLKLKNFNRTGANQLQWTNAKKSIKRAVEIKNAQIIWVAPEKFPAK